MANVRTRPRANQVLFRSPYTGDKVLDVYLAEAQIAGKDLGELLGQIFSGADGKPILLKWRGDWQAATSYYINDVVKVGFQWFIATADHVSAGSIGADFSTIVDYTAATNKTESDADFAEAKAAEATAQVVLAADQVALAANQASLAQAQATISTTQAGIATAKATEADASADAALASELLAADWAEKPTEVEAGQFSAKYWANQAGLIVADGVIDDAATSTLLTWSSQKISDDLDTKQGQLVSGTSIKTINSNSLLGSGNIAVGDVTLTGTQTLTNKTLTTPTITGAILNDGYTEEIFALSGTAPALNPANGSIQTWSLSGNSSPTASSFANGQSILLGITAGSFTVTWPSVTWNKVGGGGAAPSFTTTGINWVVLWKTGNVLRGAFLGTA